MRPCCLETLEAKTTVRACQRRAIVPVPPLTNEIPAPWTSRPQSPWLHRVCTGGTICKRLSSSPSPLCPVQSPTAAYILWTSDSADWRKTCERLCVVREVDPSRWFYKDSTTPSSFIPDP